MSAVTTSPAAAPPDVTNISATERETSVAVSLRSHPGAEGIRVVRLEQRPGQEHQEPRYADDGTAVPASLAGFTDRGLRTGPEYLYRISAVYRAPRRPAPPRYGQVRLVRAGHPPSWQAGTRVRPEGGGLSDVTGDSGDDADGRAVLRAASIPGHVDELRLATVPERPAPASCGPPSRHHCPVRLKSAAVAVDPRARA